MAFKVSNETKVGALTAIAITLLILGYNFLKGNDLFSSTKTFCAVYNNVDGLTKSNAVVINGFKVGQVLVVRPMNENDMRLYVEFEVRNDLKIAAFDSATIAASDLFGTKAIILSNCRQGGLAADGDTLFGYLKPSLTDAISNAMAPIKAKTEKLMGIIDSIAVSLKGSIGGKTSKDISASFEDIRQTLANLRSISSNLDKVVGSDASKLNQILANVASITKNLKDNNDVITKSLKNVKMMTDSLAASDLKTTINETKRAMTELNQVMHKINSGEGSIGLLINDKKLYDNLQKSSEDLDKLIIDLKQNPKRYVSFSIFGGKKKK
jgi:phospholipid/cholesterol/gamma-HCH transport system substrate-binding protein